MNEIDPLVRLSWFVAAAAPWTTTPRVDGPALAPLPAPPPLVLVDAIPSRRVGALQPELPNHPALSDTFYFGVGTSLMSSSTSAQLNSNVGVGTNVDFEDLFGLSETQWVPQGLFRWRTSDRWRLELEYFELNRSNSAVLASDINWGDQVFTAGSAVNATFDISVLRMSYGYSFFKTQDKEIGVALGFHVTDIKAKLEGPGASQDEGKLLAPLPVLSMYGQVALTDEWAVSGRLDAFKIEYDPYHGRIFSMGIDVLYQPWRHWGFGIGWRSLDISGGASGSDWNGEVRASFNGPVLFLATSF